MSHSSEENLTKYWENVTALKPDCDCSPCHRLVYHYTECHNDQTRKVDGNLLKDIIKVSQSLSGDTAEINNEMLVQLNSDISKACDCMVYQKVDKVLDAMNYWYERKKVKNAA